MTKKIIATPYSDRCSNTGHYHPPRYTCCACYSDLGDIPKGEQDCPACGTRIVASVDYVPSYTTQLVDPIEDE